MAGIRIEGNTSGTVAEVTGSNQLKVILETDAATAPQNVGAVRFFSENDPGSQTGTPYLYSPETDEDYRLRIAIDNMLDSETFNYVLPDLDQEYVLEFELSGKTDQHAVLNDQGEMDRNSCVSIRNLCFNEVPVNDILYKISVYDHAVTEPFYGALNHNGRARIEFTTPVDLWLFENK